VWGVYVTPKARGRGVGRDLLRALIERASRIEGIEQIGLSVTTTQAAAAGIYRSMGFASYAREPRGLKVEGRYIDEEYLILYVKR
jgi:ribosomal protein S18 acetylase RimI-like enzyme